MIETVAAVACGGVAFGLVWIKGLALIERWDAMKAGKPTGHVYHGDLYAKYDKLGDN